MKFDVNMVRLQIENLKISYPGLIDDDESWQMSLESETDLTDLLTSIIRRIEDAKALVIGTKDRLEDLKLRKERFEERVDALRQLTFKLMQAAEVQSIEMAEATLSIRKGTPQLVGDADAETLPGDLCNITRSVNRAKVKEALKAGQAVPGFSLSNSVPSLTIRVK